MKIFNKFYWLHNKEYWIVMNNPSLSIQLINNYNYWRSSEWHLLSFYRTKNSGLIDYYFAFFGFQLRIMTGRK